MRKPVVLICTNALILVAIFVLLAQSLVVAQRIARTDKVKGRVEIQHGADGRFATLVDGSGVKRGDTVRTGPNSSMEFRWVDGTRCKLMPNSTLTIRAASFNSVKGAEESRLHLDQGKLFVRVAKKLNADSRFEVETPSAVASVRGTIFSVEVNEGRSEVDVFRGRVVVTPASGNSHGSSVASVAVDQGREFVLAPYGNIRSLRAADTDPFEAEPSIVKPELRAWVERDSDGKGRAQLHVETEPGSVVKVDGEKVAVEGNGSFVEDVELAGGQKSWKVESIDRHGIVSQVTANVN